MTNTTTTRKNDILVRTTAHDSEGFPTVETDRVFRSLTCAQEYAVKSRSAGETVRAWRIISDDQSEDITRAM